MKIGITRVLGYLSLIVVAKAFKNCFSRNFFVPLYTEKSRFVDFELAALETKRTNRLAKKGSKVSGKTSSGKKIKAVLLSGLADGVAEAVSCELSTALFKDIIGQGAPKELIQVCKTATNDIFSDIVKNTATLQDSSVQNKKSQGAKKIIRKSAIMLNLSIDLEENSATNGSVRNSVPCVLAPHLMEAAINHPDFDYMSQTECDIVSSLPSPIPSPVKSSRKYPSLTFFHSNVPASPENRSSGKTAVTPIQKVLKNQIQNYAMSAVRASVTSLLIHSVMHSLSSLSVHSFLQQIHQHV